MVALAEFLPLLGTHALGVVGHLLARLELGLHRLDIEFAAEDGVPAIFLAGLYLPWHCTHASMVCDAEEALVYILGAGCCLMTSLVAVKLKHREISVEVKMLKSHNF